jgi:hypothetical protein
MQMSDRRRRSNATLIKFKADIAHQTINKHNHIPNMGGPHSFVVVIGPVTWRGKAMPTLQHPCSTTWLPSNGIEKPRYARNAADTSKGPALSYSSPWPWALALAISITIWLGAAWLIWTFAK